jgi:hypothetical protein
LQNFHSVLAWKAQVEDRQVRHVRQKSIDSCLAVCDKSYLVPIRLHSPPQKFPQGMIVFRNQKTHPLLLAASSPSPVTQVEHNKSLNGKLSLVLKRRRVDGICPKWERRERNAI